MIINHPGQIHIPGLRALWQDTFSDTDIFLDAFFSSAYSPNRCLCALEGETVLGAVYWFDCLLDGEPVAYLYALAVRQQRRGQGIGSRLMEAAHKCLHRRGYAGVLLVPQEENLIRMYENMGYRLSSGLREFTCLCGEKAVPLKRVDGKTYAALRLTLLPAGGVVQEGENLAFLDTQAQFYAGDGFLLAARREENRLMGLELLGDSSAAPGILKSLNCREGSFRIPGEDRKFAMYRALRPNGPSVPGYFAFAFD